MVQSREITLNKDRGVSLIKSSVEEDPYRDKRGDERYSLPTLVISIDGKLYLTKNWSLGGVLLTNYFGRRVQGDEIDGNVGVSTVPGKYPFKGITIRRDVVRSELALQFTELGDATLALLKDVTTDSP